MGESEPIRVACVQFAPRFGQLQANVDRTLALVRQAKDSGADLIVLPELCTTGYAFESQAELAALAESPDDSIAIDAWTALAAELEIHIVGGFAERARDGLFNSAILVAPGGTVACYRKTHLSDQEKDLFDPGHNGFSVYDTRIGRVSMLICYDVWFPEAMRACALAGAEIVCVPTNWSNLPEPQRDAYPMAIHLLMAGAHCNGVFLACANRVGRERGIEFNGQSAIVDKSGWLIGEPLTAVEEDIKIEICDLRRARDKHVSRRNRVLQDRRTDLYS